MVTATFDAALGGRWTSLSAGGREWLWHRGASDRRFVAPGSAFVDAGGVEECLPTIRGNPDHGDVWSRRWTALSASRATVDTGTLRLTRTFTTAGSALEAFYRLEAEPGFRFVWAAHALLDVSGSAVLKAHPGAETRIDGAGPAPWPAGLDRLGPDDGTAIGAILDCPAVTLVDGERLTFFLESPGQPVSTALWRNLRGWPADGPYRSIGVEPMLGRVWDLATAGPGDAAVVPASGVCEWRLTVSAG
jgi:hypothetical protein